MQKNTFFTKNLLQWYHPSDRPLPWKAIRNAYYIWLSEIILQQTRVEQGLPYYQKFVRKYPTVEQLADAEEDAVLKDWEGLGYYSRARNLHAAAKQIVSTHEGVFPHKYADIRALKGVGDYTAAAIASFAYNLPYAVVDGNVYRVLARFFGIDIAIDSTKGKKVFQHLADQLIDKNRAGVYNQAIMDFGATVCKPALPNCSHCQLHLSCYAYAEQAIDKLPYKAKKLKKKTRYFYYILLKEGDFYYLQKRTQKDIWRNLYEFPLLEMPIQNHEQDSCHAIMQLLKEKTLIGSNDALKTCSKMYRQTLSHQKIQAFFLTIVRDSTYPILQDSYIKVAAKALDDYAFPKIIRSFLIKNSPLG